MAVPPRPRQAKPKNENENETLPRVVNVVTEKGEKLEVTSQYYLMYADRLKLA